MAVGILDILLNGGANPRLRLGGEDTPAGGGLLDALGQSIMQRQMQPYMGGEPPVNAPQQAAEAPQNAMAAPRVSMPQSQGGGLLGRLFGGGGNARGRNETIAWLQSKGYSPEAASVISGNKNMLGKVIIEAGSPQSNDPKDNLMSVGENSAIYDARTGKWITNPNAKEKDNWINVGQGRVFNARTGEFRTSPDRGTDAPTVQTFFDDKTGQEVKKQWNPQTGEWEAVGGAKTPSGGISVTSPDGTTMTIGGNGAGQKLTEGQSKDVLYYTRGVDSNAQLDQYEAELTSLGQRAVENLPMGAGNYLQSPEYQVAKQAGANFLASVLRKDTGAAVTQQEFDIYGRMFLPQPGDSDDALQQKRRARQVALEAIKSGMGPAEAIAEANKIRLGIQDRPITEAPNPSRFGREGGVNKPVTEMTDEELRAIIDGQ